MIALSCRGIPMRRLVLLACLATLPGLPARAESPRQALFPGDASCYLRHYSRDHLASHPDQLVTEIAIGPEPGSMEADVLVLRLALYMRGNSDQLRAHAYCDNTGGTLSCALEGDAGRFEIKPTAKGAL